jgi:hypothetical protein
MKLLAGTTEWPAVDPSAKSPWLWTARQDLFWIAGGASLLFALVAAPISIAVAGASAALVTGFAHLGLVCNYPHYAVTYQLIVRERGRARSSFLWLLGSIPAALGLVAFGVVEPSIILPLVRVYLTWSAYHYAAQHFGIASMYQARAGRALAQLEKRGLQIAFVAMALHLIIVLNAEGNLGSDAAFGLRGGATATRALLPAWTYGIGVAAVVIGLAAYVLVERAHRRRTGHGLREASRLLFAANFVWFVVPFVQLPGTSGPWVGADVAMWLPFALPFFHCAQYLGVCGWRARISGAIKPALYFAGLVGIGYLLFDATIVGLDKVSGLGDQRATLLIAAVVNIHHFFLDGLVWKARRRPAAAAPSLPVAAQSAAEQRAA